MSVEIEDVARRIAVDGYAHIPAVLTADEVLANLTEARRLYDEERGELARGLRESYADHRLYSTYGDHVYNLARKTRAFDPIYEHPLAIAIVQAAMKGKFILTQTEMRRPKADAPPGSANVFHRDGRFVGDGEFWMTLFWPLEDVTLANGPTAIVPKSHRTAIEPAQCKDQELQLTARAGDLIIINSNLLHRACDTLDKTSRWVLIITYNQWYLKPTVDHTRILSRAEFDGTSTTLKELFGYSSMPPTDERKRVYTCRPWEEVIDEITFPK